MHVYSPCIKTGLHCCMHHWSVFLLTTAGDGNEVGGEAERVGGSEDGVYMNQQTETGQFLDKVNVNAAVP